MARSVRKTQVALRDALIEEHNKARLDMLKVKVGTIFHADAGPAVTTTNASDLPTLVALCVVLRTTYIAHIASACSATTGQGAHIAADATNTIAAAVPTDLATCQTFLNEAKGDYNAHRVLTASHPTADGTNVITSSDGSDLATNITLANEMKVDLNAHMAAAMGASAIQVVAQ